MMIMEEIDMEGFVKLGEAYFTSRENANTVIQILEDAGIAVCRLGQNPDDTSFMLMAQVTKE